MPTHTREKYSKGGGTDILALINQSGGSALKTLGTVPKLSENMSCLLHASLASGTWKKYASGWKTFDAYEAWIGKKFSWPLSKETIRGFAVYCITERKLRPSSVRTYLSSLVCLHKLKGYTSYEMKDSLVDAILKGAGNLLLVSPTPPSNTRRVMTLPLLRHLGHKLKLSGWSKCSQQTIWTAAVVAFFASARMGELLAAADHSFDTTANLTWACVQYRADSNSFLVHVRLPKTGAKEGDFLDIFPFPESGCCPVAALKKHFAMQKECGRGRPQDPVFTYPSGKYLTPAGFNGALRTLLADICDFKRDTISGHSFRAAVPSALSRFPDLMSSDDVKGWGRWDSDCYSRYTRLKVDQKLQIFRKIMSVFM